MHSRQWSPWWAQPTVCRWLLWLLLIALAQGSVAAAGQTRDAASQGTIAYVRPDGTQGDQIRLIEPDGTGDRVLWRTDHSHGPGLVDIAQLAWKPDASELAFTSHHEAACSFYATDIYTIWPDGSGYRRVTAPPACGLAAGLPAGTVRVNIENNTYTSGPFVAYIEGAPQPQTLVLAQGEAATITFEGVVDFGSQVQWAVVINGEERYHSVSGNADVLAGQTVDTKGTILMSYPVQNWDWRWPTWRSDGTQLAYIFGTGTLYAIDPGNTVLGATGEKLFDAQGMPLGPDHLVWAPSAARATQFLYTGYQIGGDESGETIYLLHEGGSTPGQPLVWVDQGVGRVVLGLAWLPDGTGFVYSATEGFGDRANLYLYRFATQQFEPLTSFNKGYPRALSLSPDGQQIVFEYQPSGEWTDLDPPIDLWRMDVNGGEPEQFLENSRSPAWSLRTPQVLPPAHEGHSLYLPCLQR